MNKPEATEVFGARRTSLGASAATYDAVRPEWPDKTVAWMLGSPTTGTVCRVVDVGAGTGKGTRAIAALGHEVIAVEPSDGMLEALKSSLGALPEDVAGRITLMAGGAENIPAPSDSVEVVTAFQGLALVRRRGRRRRGRTRAPTRRLAVDGMAPPNC